MKITDEIREVFGDITSDISVKEWRMEGNKSPGEFIELEIKDRYYSVYLTDENLAYTRNGHRMYRLEFSDFDITNKYHLLVIRNKVEEYNKVHDMMESFRMTIDVRPLAREIEIDELLK